MAITHCICYNISLERLKQIQQENKCETIEEIQKIEEFGLSCGMCVDYVKMMIKTGKTSFDLRG